MKFAADFRLIARNALRGRWMIAVLVGLVAMLLGGVENGGPQIKLNFNCDNRDFGKRDCAWNLALNEKIETQSESGRMSGPRLYLFH